MNMRQFRHNPYSTKETVKATGVARGVSSSHSIFLFLLLLIIIVDIAFDRRARTSRQTNLILAEG